MTTNNIIDALFADAELPFGHPGRRFDDTPEGFDQTPLLDQGPEQDYTPDEEGGVVHYAPGDRPSVATRASPRSTQTTPLGLPAAPSAWSWSWRTCRTTTTTWVAAFTAAARSPPRAGWLGAGRPEALPALRDDRLVTGAGLLTVYIALRYPVNYLLPVRWSVA